MATAVTPQPQISPGLSNLLNTFANYAALAAAAIQKEQADIAAKDHVAAVVDAINIAGAGLAAAVPGWGADIDAALGLANAFIPVFVGLFHKNKPAAS